MNFSLLFFASVDVRPPAAVRRRRKRPDAFALVVTLLILSLLIVVAVSYLTSMVNERQTADAFTAKTRAEEAAQAGVDSAMAVLAQSFRDFPDSVTVWDTQQSQNSGTSTNASIVNTPYNEGTSLYLRAVVDPSTGTAKPLPLGVPAAGATPVPANDPGGNDPNNPACKNFVLPLISGVPNGQAQLVSKKASILPAMNLSEPDPAKQNFVDLNARRYGPNAASPIAAVKQYGDIWGAIGSPPDWTSPSSTAASPVGPKPARALWVNLKDNNGLLTGRYAFWIEDESFRSNVNSVNFDNNNVPTDPIMPSRADNSADGKSVVDPTTSLPRPVLPKDSFLSGSLAGFPTVFTDPATSVSYTQSVLNTRTAYPGSFLPEPQAFSHTANTGTASPTPMPTPVSEGLRYLTTTQSGTLNLTRHGSQRLNLNAATTIDALNPVTMPEIRKLVEGIRFHLPNFGQRFYRLNNPYPPSPTVLTPTQTGTILNRLTDVSSNYAEIYLYKTAANLRDYVDVDDQPTMIVRPMGGQTLPSLWVPGTPTQFPFGGDGKGGNGSNYMWAQGKDGAPFIQEAMVRYRPTIPHDADYGDSYTLLVDYYVEFWNMTDHDVYASNLNHPFLRISSQQPWAAAYIPSTNGTPTTGASPQVQGELAGLGAADGPSRDFNLDLVKGVFRGDNPTSVTTGVVFKAGQATVITSDPDFVANGTNTPVIKSINPYGGLPLSSAGLVPTNVYYCSNASPARKTYSGPTNLTYKPGFLRGIMPNYWDTTSSTVFLNFEVEATLFNDLGYLDCATGAFCISAGKTDAGTNGWDFTWKSGGDVHNDYIHGGTLAGNGNTPSELGDPRTNNEQLTIQLYNGTSFPVQPDQYRYGSPSASLNPPYSLGSPNSQYVKPANSSGTFTAWGDYYDWPNAVYPPPNPTFATSPAVIANSPLTSIGQLGDLFDPVRVIGTVGAAAIENSRGGGRTLKIGQRDDRFWYDPTTNPSGTNTLDNTAVSNGWASWRLTDVFGISDDLELPARININGVARDGGAALRAALTGFAFQPQTQGQTLPDNTTKIVDPLIHGTANLAGVSLIVQPSNPPKATDQGVPRLISQIKARLDPGNGANGNTPYGPFFERGELGELENGASALFGKNVSSTYLTTTDLTGKDLNHTFDRGREELFRRLVELTCTRGDTFTVYAVGQSLVQTDTTKSAKITGTHRLRVTFRLVPQQYKDNTRTTLQPFHPGNTTNPDGSLGVAPPIPDPDKDPAGFAQRFAKPDLYAIQVLEVNTL